MAASVVAVTLYTVALLVFGLGYAVVFFTAGKITSARHTKIFYLAAAATLAWFITDIADTSLSLFADFVVEIDTTGLIYLTQGLSYFITFVLAFRLNSQSDSKKVWLLLLIPVAVTAVVIGLELTMEISDFLGVFVARSLLCHISLIIGMIILMTRHKQEVLHDKLANGSRILDQDIGKFMVIPFVLANAMAVAQDGFQGYLSVNRNSFLSPTAYYVFTSTGWLEWLFFLAAFPGSYVLALARSRYGSRRKGDEALIPQ